MTDDVIISDDNFDSFDDNESDVNTNEIIHPTTAYEWSLYLKQKRKPSKKSKATKKKRRKK